jgi:hypothetical protein
VTGHEHDSVADLAGLRPNVLGQWQVHEVRQAPDGGRRVRGRLGRRPARLIAASGEALGIRRSRGPRGVSTRSVNSPRGGSTSALVAELVMFLLRQQRLYFSPLPHGQGLFRSDPEPMVMQPRAGSR